MVDADFHGQVIDRRKEKEEGSIEMHCFSTVERLHWLDQCCLYRSVNGVDNSPYSVQNRNPNDVIDSPLSV